MRVRPGNAAAAAGLFTTTAVVSLVACDAGREGERHWTVRDSAGIAIVENRAPGSWGPAKWSLSTEPIVDITQAEDDPAGIWTYLRRAFWWSDGRIGVAVSDPPFLRVYSSAGSLLGTVGRQGEGPGELRAVTWAGAREDSAVLRGPRGLSVYGPDGTFARRIPLALEGSPILATTPSGWVVKTRQPYEDDHADPPLPPQVTAAWTIVNVDRGGIVTDTLAQFEQVLTWRVQGALWGELDHVASDGELVYEMDSRRFELRVHRDRRLTRIIRAPVPTISEFTERHLELVREQWGEIADRLIDSDREAGRLVVPPAVTVLMDERGEELWIRRADDGPAADARVWDVFTKAGAWIATLGTPPQFIIREVRGGRVLGTWTDALGVTSVRVFAVERDGRG